MAAFDIVVPGHYFCDIIFNGLPEFPRLGAEIYSQSFGLVTGGGALNTAIALRRLGVNIGWIGALGNDFFSQAVARQIAAEGLATDLISHLDQPLRRVTVALSYPADRAFVSYTDPLPEETRMIYTTLKQADYGHLHFSGLTIDEEVPALLDDCRARGIQISMDCQHREETLDSPLVRDILARLDIFMPNAGEAKRLTGSETLTQALHILGEIVPCVVIKCGEKGALAQCGGHEYNAPPLKVTPLDTTGAGDVFNAGFLAAYLRGHDLEACLRWGNFCGGRSTLGFGGSCAPTEAELRTWLEGGGGNET